MELNKFDRQLKLIELLIDNQHLSIEEIGNTIGISTRSVYRYIQFFENLGFEVFNDQGIYSIGHNSPFIAAISQKMHFSSEELGVLGEMISRADTNNPVVNKLKYKFRNVYGLDFRSDEFRFDKKISENIDSLRQAIKGKKQCVLQKYNSLNSKETRDRLVEPFQFLSSTNEVRCYEPESDMCKTFKVTRIKGKVFCRDKKWEFTDRHVSFFTDIFGFSSEKVTKVILRLTTLSKTILMEEFGLDETRFVKEDDLHFLVHLPICHNKGAGRFVLGLIDEVEIVKGNSLKQYVDGIIQNFLQRK